MKLALTSVASVAIVSLTVACAASNLAARPRNAAAGPFAAQGSGFGADLLRMMNGLSGFDALRMLPAYYARVHERPSPRFLLVIDGARTSYLDLLRSIQATDLLEIHVANSVRQLRAAERRRSS